MKKAVNQQSRADQQDEGNRDFTDHKQAPNAIATRPGARIPASFLQCFVETEVRCLRRGYEAKNHSCQQRYQCGKDQHFSVNADGLSLRDRIGDKRFQHIDSRDCEQ